MADEKLITAAQLRNTANRVDDEMDALDAKNADIAKRYDMNLAASGWALDGENAVYVYTYNIAGVTAEHRADAVLDDISAKLAAGFGMYPTTETVTNGVVFKSKKLPESNLTGQIYITESVAAAAAASVEQEGN